MFRQRTSAAKPGDELLATFREQFPHLSSTGETTVSTAATVANVIAPDQPGAVLASQDRPQPLAAHEAFRDQDPTPRASGNDLFKFTPSLMDPNSFSFASFANAPPGYYTPTPGGTNTLYHPQAGDLHTPSLALGMGLGTPLSMPTTEATSLHPTTTMMDIGTSFHHGMHHPAQPQFHPHAQFHHPFIQPPQAQQSFAPSTFVHQDTGYETMDQDGSPMESDAADEGMVSLDSTFPAQPPMVGFQGSQATQFIPLNVGLPASAEKFRFHATLNAPTAMIKHADEIPVTYLNKGQAYSLSIIDTTPTIPIQPGTRFRTFVRVSFEDEQQRQKPGVCWSLWKEGRGTNEAHQRGGKLQAVEYVEAGQPAEGDEKRTRIELESSSFDGFSVIWTPGIHGAAECTIAVRFNFLSTDFSHSKGVKGIPVRLCAKTTSLPLDASTQPNNDPTATEICYCKVKLFRDHGAERKLANDVQHVKKTIDKLKQQIAQAESGLKDLNKRKRSGGAHGRGQEAQRPGKVQKHKRTWSMSSTSSAGAQRPPLEEDLHFKLQTLQDMFTSTRPVSILYLRGEELDDPDLHPVALPGDSLEPSKSEPRDGSAWQPRSGRSSLAGSSLVSPSPSSLSLHSQASAANAQWQDFDETGKAVRASSDQPVKINKTDDTGSLTGWIEALGVDASYRPPPERSVKPVACFYVLRRDPGNPEVKEFYRAIYLMQRNLKEFVSRIAAKWGIEESRVVRVVHALDRGLEVEMDDDVIAELPEGQDMTLEIADLSAKPTSVKREWEMSVDEQSDNDAISTRTATKSGYELRLSF